MNQITVNDKTYFGFEAYEKPSGRRAFISYKRMDAQRIYPIVKKLSTYGGEASNLWYDGKIEHGTLWEKIIRANIHASSCVVAFISRNVFETGYIMKELTYAMKVGKLINVVMIDDFDPELSLRSAEEKRFWKRLMSYDLIQAFDKDTDTVAEMIHSAIASKMIKDPRPIRLVYGFHIYIANHPRAVFNMAATVLVVLLLMGVYTGVQNYAPELVEQLVSALTPQTEERGPEEEDVIIGQTPPVFTLFTASSSYNKDENNNCKPIDAFDADISTAWQDGVDGYGEGEYIKAEASNLQHVESVTIVNGYAGSEKLYQQNSRVASLLIEWEGGDMTISLKDSPEEYTVDLGGVNTRWMKFTILEVYEGDRYSDTCIADIYFD